MNEDVYFVVDQTGISVLAQCVMRLTELSIGFMLFDIVNSHLCFVNEDVYFANL